MQTCSKKQPCKGNVHNCLVSCERYFPAGQWSDLMLDDGKCFTFISLMRRAWCIPVFARGARILLDESVSCCSFSRWQVCQTSHLPCHWDMAMFSSTERLWNESDRLRWHERNESSEDTGQDDAERNYYAMFYSLLILAIVFGNVLVCLAVLRERSLQTTTNYLVVSLAVADLLVASLVMPWAVYLEVRRSSRYIEAHWIRSYWNDFHLAVHHEKCFRVSRSQKENQVLSPSAEWVVGNWRSQ